MSQNTGDNGGTEQVYPKAQSRALKAHLAANAPNQASRPQTVKPKEQARVLQASNDPSRPAKQSQAQNGKSTLQTVRPKEQTRAMQAYLAPSKKNNAQTPNNDEDTQQAFPRAQVSAIEEALIASKKKPAQAAQATQAARPNAKSNIAFPKKEVNALDDLLNKRNDGNANNKNNSVLALKPVEQIKALGQALGQTFELGPGNVVGSKPVPISDKPVPNKDSPARITQADIEPKPAMQTQNVKADADSTTGDIVQPKPPTAGIPTTKPTAGIPTTKPTAGIPTTKPTAGIPTTKPTAGTPAKPPSASTPAKPTDTTEAKPPSKPFTNPFKLPKLPKMPNMPSLFGKKPAAVAAAPERPEKTETQEGPDKPDKPDKPSLFSRLFGKKPGKGNEGDSEPLPPSPSQQQQQQKKQQEQQGKEERAASLPRQLPASYPPRTRGFGDDSPDKERGYPAIPALGNDYGLHEPPASSRFFDTTKSALFADPMDPKRIEQIFKEFQRFAANIASVSTSMINNLKTQTNNFRSLVAKTDEMRRNDLYTNFLATLEKVMDRYMQLHKVFLIDNNFSKKLQYAWRYAPDVTQQQVDAFTKNVIDPYFANIAEITANAMPKHMVGGAAGKVNEDNETSSPGIYYAYEKYMERLESEREKLYDFYYNKASNAMFQWTSTHTLIYSMKFLRVLFLWMALYLASKTFQARYVQKVFADNEDPPRLEVFVLMFWALEAVLMVFVFIILYLIKYLLNSDSNFIINDGVIGKFIGDYFASTALIVLAGLVIGRIMMKKKYFRYKSDGLRAIRSFEEVMWYISIFILAFPFFIIF
jgi:hypothetical protein